MLNHPLWDQNMGRSQWNLLTYDISSYPIEDTISSNIRHDVYWNWAADVPIKLTITHIGVIMYLYISNGISETKVCQGRHEAYNVCRSIPMFRYISISNGYCTVFCIFLVFFVMGPPTKFYWEDRQAIYSEVRWCTLLTGHHFTGWFLSKYEK